MQHIVSDVVTWDTGMDISGHAMAVDQARRRLLLFGGIPAVPDADEAGAAALLEMPIDVLLRRMETSTPRPCRWTPIDTATSTAEKPRSRHGHSIHVCDDSCFVLGGNYWAARDESATFVAAFHLGLRTWRRIVNLNVPSRFAGATAGIHTPAGENDQPGSTVYIFGGLDHTQRPTDTLIRVDFRTCSAAVISGVGVAPPLQFKGGMVQCGGSLILVDGWCNDAPNSVRRLDLATFVWRVVAMGPRLGRFELVVLSPQRPNMFVLTGGILVDDMKRSDELILFDTEQGNGQWVGKRFSLASRGVRGTTAHSAVLVEAAFAGADTHIVWFGGSVDSVHTIAGSDPPEPIPVPTSSLHVLTITPPTLAELCARRVHEMGLPIQHLFREEPPPRDEVLDSLF